MKKFLVLFFLALACCQDNPVNAAAAAPTQAATSTTKLGSKIIVMFNDNSRIEFNQTDSSYSYYDTIGAAVGNIPGNIYAQAIIEISRFLANEQRHMQPAATPRQSRINAGCCAAITPAIIFPTLLLPAISWISNLTSSPIRAIIDKRYWELNCNSAMERGGSDYLRALFTCPLARTQDAFSLTLTGITTLTLAVIIYLYVQNKIHNTQNKKQN